MQKAYICTLCADKHKIIINNSTSCPNCGNMLVTVVWSLITGEPLTGSADNVNYEQFKGEE